MTLHYSEGHVAIQRDALRGTLLEREEVKNGATSPAFDGIWVDGCARICVCRVGACVLYHVALSRYTRA